MAHPNERVIRGKIGGKPHITMHRRKYAAQWMAENFGLCVRVFIKRGNQSIKCYDRKTIEHIGDAELLKEK